MRRRSGVCTSCKKILRLGYVAVTFGWCCWGSFGRSVEAFSSSSMRVQYPHTAYRNTQWFPSDGPLIGSLGLRRASVPTTVLTAQSKETDSLEKDETSLAATLFDSTTGNPSPFLTLLMSQFLLFMGVGAVIPGIPLYGRELGLSGAANGMVLSAPALALLLGARWGGQYADRARKPAMMIGMAVIAVSDLGTALATGWVTLLVARLGLGAGRCVSEAGERGWLADWIATQAPALRGRALAAQQACMALGIAIGAPFGGYVVETYSPRAAFLCVSVAAVVAFICYSFLPETISQPAGENEEHSMAKVNSDSVAEHLDGTDVGTATETTMAEMERALLGPSETVAVSPSSTDSNPNTATNTNPAKAGDWSQLLSQNAWRGLALCQSGASFGFAAKIASVPILAASILPGGALGAGALVSACGLSGIVGAPIGGWWTDRTQNAQSTAVASGIISAVGLLLVPWALQLPAEMTTVIDAAPGGDQALLWGMDLPAVVFSLVVLLWSLGAAAQGPALTALAQQLAPPGAEATAMALPRATGDGTYIAAPFLLGLVTDATWASPGVECAVAGAATLCGSLALAVLGGDDASFPTAATKSSSRLQDKNQSSSQ